MHRFLINGVDVTTADADETQTPFEFKEQISFRIFTCVSISGMWLTQGGQEGDRIYSYSTFLNLMTTQPCIYVNQWLLYN